MATTTKNAPANSKATPATPAVAQNNGAKVEQSKSLGFLQLSKTEKALAKRLKLAFDNGEALSVIVDEMNVKRRAEYDAEEHAEGDEFKPTTESQLGSRITSLVKRAKVMAFGGKLKRGKDAEENPIFEEYDANPAMEKFAAGIERIAGELYTPKKRGRSRAQVSVTAATRAMQDIADLFAE